MQSASFSHLCKYSALVCFPAIKMTSLDSATSQPSKRGRKSVTAAKAKEKREEVSDIHKLDLLTLKEIKAHNPYAVTAHKSKPIWEKIIERSNELIDLHKLKVDYRNDRNIKDRLKKLIRDRKAKDKKEASKTGGGSVDPLSETEQLLVDIIADQDKSKDRSREEVEKEDAEASEVASIQKQALLTIRRKRDDDENFDGLEDWRAEEEREFLQAVGIDPDNRQEEEEDGSGTNISGEKSDGKDDGKQKKSGSEFQPSAARKRLRGNATERMMNNKMKVDREMRTVEMKTKLEIAKMESADREKDRELRRKEQEIQEQKIKFEHEYNLKKLELEMQVKLEKQKKINVESQTVSALLKQIPSSSAFNHLGTFDYQS